MQTEQQLLRAAAGQRFWQIDALRGLALLNMLVYHAMYDWVYIFGHASGWYDIWSTHCHVWQQYICWSFILLSGYSFTLSRRPLKNGLLTAACAALLTCLLHPALEKLPPLAGVTGSAVLFALLNQLPQGWLGFEGTHLAALPAAWYKPNLFWLGLPDLTVFSSSDYFPLLPWVFLYWVGYFFARWFRDRCTAQPGQPPKALRPLCAVGSRTLLIYMLHQPVIYGALLGLRYLGFV